MNILITGGTGFVGYNLVLKLMELGHRLTFVSRNPAKIRQHYGDMHTYHQWDALSGPPEKSVFDGVDGVINLMGEGVANKRWTTTQKKKLYDSRVLGTRNLVEGVLSHAPGLSFFLQASAIGYYDHAIEGPLTESAPGGTDFLSHLCKDWEAEGAKVKQIQSLRYVCFRIGIVLGDGGALSKIKVPFLLGVGGQLGSGKQWMNWIHLEDLTRLMSEATHNESFKGTYNAVSPNNATNKQFTKALSNVLRRPALFRVPSVALKLVLGEFSQEVLRGGNVSSKKLQELGVKFKFPDLDESLEAALNIKYIPHLKKKVRCLRLHTSHFLPYTQQRVFDFFSDAKNLERLTPAMLNFKIVSQSTDAIQDGTIFKYKLRVRGIPLKWTSLICDWNPQSYFVDTQLKGPYYVWHHTHRFMAYNDGTFTEDEVYYALPRIPFAFVATAFVRKDVEGIFKFRKQTIDSLFD